MTWIEKLLKVMNEKRNTAKLTDEQLKKIIKITTA